MKKSAKYPLGILELGKDIITKKLFVFKKKIFNDKLLKIIVNKEGDYLEFIQQILNTQAIPAFFVFLKFLFSVHLYLKIYFLNILKGCEHYFEESKN